MKWDKIIKAHPKSKEDILKAKEIRKITLNIIQRKYSEIRLSTSRYNDTEISILEQDSVRSEILDIIETICLRAWEKVFGGDLPESTRETIGNMLSPFGNIESARKENKIEMIVHNVTIEAMTFLRKANNDVLPRTWSHGRCPFCGTYPRLAYDSEAGRQLCCPICEYSWRFPRLKCPYCNNTDHNLLGYFEADGINGIRVYFCKKCMYYIKSIDTRKRRALDPETDDILSLEMDNLALKEGFKA